MEWFLFSRLLLGHLIGDFPLQTGTIYRLKIQSLRGTILHAGIVTFTMCLMGLPYWGYGWFWAAMIFVLISHTVEDWAKVNVYSRWAPLNGFWGFFLDQVIHVVTIFVIFLTPLGYLPVAEVPTLSNTGSWLVQLYLDNHAMVIITAYVFSLFAGTYFLSFFKASFYRAQEGAEDRSLENLNRRFGILERTLITTSFLYPDRCFYLILLAGLLRLPFPKLRVSVDYCLNLAFAGCIGVAMWMLLLAI
ncbi:MAG: DUF3307 domain-containing protein [Candidatus Omnitrophica bacterium]|nr:DUF3307 domain-containing protein [Candidatus Omnitrophota bacterium]